MSYAPSSLCEWPKFRAAVAFLAVAGLGCGSGGGADARGASSLGSSVGDPVVASWEGGEIRRSELEALAREELRRMTIAYEVERHELLHRTLQGRLDELLLAAAAEKRGVNGVDAMLDQGEPVAESSVPEAWIQQAYERFRETVPSASLEAARPYLEREYRRTQAEDRRKALEERVREELGLKVHLPFPDLPRVNVGSEPWNPTLGPPDAAVTIVEFGSYQCYYCKRMHDVVLEAVDRWPEQVRLVYRNFPLEGQEHAHRAAASAHCADQQGRWRDMAGVLLNHQGHLDPTRLRKLADGLHLDVDAWEACMEELVWSGRIEQDVHAGRAAGVNSTPTFFVNGLMVVGAVDRRRFLALVMQELERLGVDDR